MPTANLDDSPPLHRSCRDGFTLFEVAISLVLVSFGVISVMAMLPQGLRAQQLARYQIHAAVIAQNLNRLMVSPAQLFESTQIESQRLSNNLFLDRATANLENIAVGSNLGIAPMPTEIARRIDSDNDEIRRNLDGGGYLYYNLPGNENEAGVTVPGDMPPPTWPGGTPQSLVLGFVGYAQQNALPNHPCVAWPYWDQHPCAPSAWEWTYWMLNQNWPGVAQLNTLYGVLNSNSTPSAATITTAKWTAYLQAAQDLVTAVAAEPSSGLSVQSTAGGPVLSPPTALPVSGWDTRPATEQRNIYPRPYVVWAASHLAHAAALGTGTVADRAGPATALQIQYARDTFESCRQWVARLRTDPYDWAVARQTAQQTAWDFPLIEHDLFAGGAFPSYEDTSSDLTVPTTGGASQHDRAWRVVTGRPVIYYGQARGAYGNVQGTTRINNIPANRANIAAGWGDPTHFTLTRRFDPSERMRQVVFWAVDWQSYEDFETQPASLHDSSMGFKDSYGVNVSTDWWGISLPERNFYWSDQSRTQTAIQVRAPTPVNQTYDPFCDTAAYKGGFFMGAYGADRNGNGRLDHGTLPVSARIRATLVARFTIYDRILIGEARH